MGEFRIGPGGGMARTIVPGIPEQAEIKYKVHFSSRVGSFDREFGPDGGVVQLATGNWQVTVKAYNNEPRLRGIAQETINVSADGSHTVTLETCIGIKTEAELAAALGPGNWLLGGYTFSHDVASGKGDLLVLEDDITLASGGLWGSFSMHTGGPLTIIAEPGERRTITKADATVRITVPSGGT